MKEDYLKHSIGVGKLTMRMIQCKNPNISEGERLACFLTGFFHDIGKEEIDKRFPGLLEKADPLTSEEWEIIQTHTMLGYEILRRFEMQEILNTAYGSLEHHERWNGSGYMGKKGLEISLTGRVLAVADVYDALCKDRVYRKAWSKGSALDYIRQNSGILFDPEWVDALMRIEGKEGEDS